MIRGRPGDRDIRHGGRDRQSHQDRCNRRIRHSRQLHHFYSEQQERWQQLAMHCADEHLPQDHVIRHCRWHMMPNGGHFKAQIRGGTHYRDLQLCIPNLWKDLTTRTTSTCRLQHVRHLSGRDGLRHPCSPCETSVFETLLLLSRRILQQETLLQS